MTGVRGPRVVVIGAGIVGASVAWHLTGYTADVVVIDQNATPGMGVTGRAFGWVGLAAADPRTDPALFRLRLQSLHDWDRFISTFGTRLTGCARGALTWQETPDQTQAWVDAHRAEGHDIQAVSTTQVRAIEPALSDPPPLAGFAPGDLALNPGDLSRCLLQDAIQRGARLCAGQQVCEIETRKGAVKGVRMQSGRIPADIVVVAAGTGSVALARGLGQNLDIAASPAVLIRAAATPGIVRHIVESPDIELRQKPDGTIMIAEWFPPDGETGLPAVARAALAAADRLFPALAPVLRDVETGQRPVTTDGWPMIGYLDSPKGVYITAAHPGVILAPFIGRVAAAEILTGVTDDDAGRFVAR